MITTSGPIIGLKYSGGILLTSEKNISYGSAFKFNNYSHFIKLTPNCVIGCTGEMADFQALTRSIKLEIGKYHAQSEDFYLTPSEIFTLTKRVLYNQRSRMKPLFVKIVIAGCNADGSSFLAVCDEHGSWWETDVAVTGLLQYLRGQQLEEVVNKDKDTVLAGLRNVLKGVSVRCATSTGDWEVLDLTKEGVTNLEPLQIQGLWKFGESPGNEWTQVC